MSKVLEIKTDFANLSRQYAGKWVAIDPERGAVLASGDSAAEVLEKAGKAGVSEPLITLVVDNYAVYIPCAIA